MRNFSVAAVVFRSCQDAIPCLLAAVGGVMVQGGVSLEFRTILYTFLLDVGVYAGINEAR